jgi:hypothetical protein
MLSRNARHGDRRDQVQRANGATHRPKLNESVRSAAVELEQRALTTGRDRHVITALSLLVTKLDEIDLRATHLSVSHHMQNLALSSTHVACLSLHTAGEAAAHCAWPYLPTERRY